MDDQVSRRKTYTTRSQILLVPDCSRKWSGKNMIFQFIWIGKMAADIWQDQKVGIWSAISIHVQGEGDFSPDHVLRTSHRSLQTQLCAHRWELIKKYHSLKPSYKQKCKSHAKRELRKHLSSSLVARVSVRAAKATASPTTSYKPQLSFFLQKDPTYNNLTLYWRQWWDSVSFLRSVRVGAVEPHLRFYKSLEELPGLYL